MSLLPVILILAIVGAFGVLVPTYKGLDFLDPRLIAAYGCLSAIIAAPLVIDRSARPQDENPLPFLLRVWLYSWAFAAFLLALALVIVNLQHAHGRIILPRTSFLISVECLSATVAAAVAGLGALLVRRFSAVNVRAGFRALFLILVVALFLADRYGALSLTISGLTRLLFILSSLFGAAALVLHVMLTVGGAHSRNWRGSGGV